MRKGGDPDMLTGDYGNFNTNPLSVLTDTRDLMELFRLNFGVSPKDSRDFGNNAPTAIMVPGWGCRKGSMSVLGDSLKESMNVVYADNFPLMNTGSIAESAKLLEPIIRGVMEIEKNGGIILVTHSNGGHIGFRCLQLATHLRVLDVVTMGTPCKGTPHARLPSIISASCREINQEWGLLRGMNLRGQVEGGILALVAANDKIVPRQNQIPPYSLVGRERTRTRTFDIGHLGFIMGDSVEKVSRIIQRSF